MALSALLIRIHVLTAILGVGQVAGMTVLASSARAETPAASTTWTALARLSRATSWSLIVMIVSGGLLDRVAGWGYHRAWWFRLSFFLVVALGVINGVIRRVLRRRESLGDARALRSVVRSAWIMCAIVFGITVLMEVKPW